MITLRPFNFSDEDYASRVAIYNATNPVPASVQFERRFDRTTLIEPGRVHYAVLAEYDEAGGQAIASGRYFPSLFDQDRDKYIIEVAVVPEFEHTGVRRLVHDHLMDQLMPHEPHDLEAMTFADRPHIIHFLEDEGYVEVQRQRESVLDTADFDPERFQPVLDLVAASGIQLKSYGELLQSDPELHRKLYELEGQLIQDVPWYAEEAAMTPFNEWATQFEDNPDLLPDAYFVAVDGDQFVGESILWASQATDQILFTALTGVLPAYRRQGVATALKVKAIAAGKQHVDRQGRPPLVRTSNELNNPMYQINVKLGFKPVPDTIIYHKLLRLP